jgi:uncharacterized protein YegP (UPF0339 family)
MRILIDHDGDRYRWTLVRANGHGADVVARGVRSYPDERDCHHALAAVATAGADAALVIEQPDGQWRWIVTSADGEPLAESPAMFRDPAACSGALAELRRYATAFALVT